MYKFRLDFTGKVSEPFLSLKQTTDMEILRAWHREPSNQGLPVVFVVENAESCEWKILAELIMLLR